MAHRAGRPAMAGIDYQLLCLWHLAAIVLLMSMAPHAGAEVMEEIHGPILDIGGAGLNVHAGFSREQDQGLKRTAALEFGVVHSEYWTSMTSVSLEGWSEDSMRVSSWEWAHRFELANLQDGRAGLGFHMGIERTLSDDGPWKFSAGPLMQWCWDKLELRLNLIYQRSWVAHDAVSSWRSRLKLHYGSGESMEPGLLGFATLRRHGRPDDEPQPNAIGPALFGRLGSAAAPVQFETGLLFLLRGHRTNGAMLWLQAEIPF
jgi:hypothetical protein